MDLAQATNATQLLTLGGWAFPVRQLQLADWGRLQAWLKGVYPSPVTVALRSLQEARDLGYPVAPELRDELLNHAHESARAWPPPVGGRAWLKALDQVEGGRARFVQAVLQAGGTEVSIDEARTLFDSASQEEADALFSQAYYGDPPAPKAQGDAASAAATGSAESTTTSPPSPVPTNGD